MFMNVNILPKQEDKVTICNALGCKEKAIKEIKLEVGKYGKISLFLCRICIPKFTKDG